MVFSWLARFILRNRILLLIVIGAITVFMGYKAFEIQLSYDFAKILPADDPDFKAYEKFKTTFGEDGSVMVIGIEDKNFYQLQRINDWWQLGEDIKKIDGIEAVVSVARLFNVVKNDETRKFDLKPLMKEKFTSQEQVDSLKAIIDNLPFYRGYINNPETGATVMAVTFDKNKLNTKSRIDIINYVKDRVLEFGEKNQLEMHMSGMPYIRTLLSQKISQEMKLFMLLAFLVTAIILFAFFRSFQVVVFSLLVVLVGVVWSLGTIALFGYKITVLSGLIPPLIIVIGVPNSILMLNKYQSEFSRHGSQAKALARMIQRMGFTTFLANVTTAIGFFVFYFTHSRLLMEFGLVAATNVLSTYLISLFMIPIVFSYLREPKVKHTKHLDGKRINKILGRVDKWVHHHTKTVYGTVVVILLISFYGMTKLSTVGYVIDDLPKKDPIYMDMRFFERNFKGVLPLEFSIETKTEGGVLKLQTLQKINRLEKLLGQYDVLSKPIAIVDGIKFTYQAYNGGDPKFYIIPGSVQLAEMAGFVGEAKGKEQLFKSFIDSTKQLTRVSVQMADIGSIKMEKLLKELHPRVDSIFPKENYDVKITGNSLIFLKGSNYLFKNLMESIALAIFLISIIMVLLFMSLRMILISIIPSLIPLIMTAGLMGFFHIPLKPSTILIFSIAFGIASDQTIYFLTKYRQEMRANPIMNISKAVTITIRETGVSMIYTAIILFFGFFIFSASSFGGTSSLGKLISFTLLMSVCSNLVLLPAFLVSLERKLTTKAFLQEPLFQQHNEDDDIDLDELEIKKNE